jgi:hypothetical protein
MLSLDYPTPCIESMQALVLLSSFAGWYVTIDEGKQIRRDYARVLNIARKSGLLKPLDTTNPPLCWEQWVYEEKRRRWIHAKRA